MSDPLTVKSEQVLAALDLLGIDVAEVTRIAEVRITGHAITVRRYRRNTAGNLVAAAGEPMTETVEIGIDWPTHDPKENR